MPPLGHDPLSEIDPPFLTNLRVNRYRAEEQAIDASLLHHDDRDVVHALYAMLGELESLIGASAQDDARDNLDAFVARHDLSNLVQRVRTLGSRPTDPRVVVEALHDVRGGALTSIVMRLGALHRVRAVAEAKRMLFIAARDHRKVMRNVLLDLDASARARDLEAEAHSLAQLAAALRAFSAGTGEGPVRIDVECPVDAIVAESCVECAAVDRAAFNLLNNAIQHGAAAPIRTRLSTGDHDVRVAVANAVSPAQREVVAARLAEDPASLHGAFSTTGSGHGLHIVAELVGHAYGVASHDALVHEGYVGARVVADAFLTWFHWPLARP